MSTLSAFAVLSPGARAVCPHGGQMPTVLAETRVLTSGQALVTSVVPVSVAGCSFAPGTNPHPCTYVSGLKPSTRVFVNGKPALLATPPLLCKAADQVPQGAPLLLQFSTRAVGS